VVVVVVVVVLWGVGATDGASYVGGIEMEVEDHLHKGRSQNPSQQNPQKPPDPLPPGPDDASSSTTSVSPVMGPVLMVVVEVLPGASLSRPPTQLRPPIQGQAQGRLDPPGSAP